MGVSVDALFHGSFNATGVVDELCAVFKDEVASVYIAECPADGEFAAGGNGHQVVGVKGQTAGGSLS